MGKLNRLIENRKSMTILERCEECITFLKYLPEDVSYKCKRAYKRVIKLSKFLALGWNDEDYDHSYLTDMLVYKLNAMSELQKKEGHGVTHLNIAKQLRVARKALQLWQKDDYYINYIDKKEKTAWEYASFPSTEGFFRLERVYTGTDLRVSEKDTIVIGKNSNAARRYEARMKKKYKRIFFRIMYKHYEQWWD